MSIATTAIATTAIAIITTVFTVLIIIIIITTTTTTTTTTTATTTTTTTTGNTIVIQSSAIWCELHRKLIEASLVEVLGLEVELLWRQQASRLKQDGYNGVIENKSDQPEISSSSSSGSGSGGGGGSDSVDQYSVEVIENGVRYLTNPKDGQKTGMCNVV